MSQVLLVSPYNFTGTINDTPSGTTYHVTPRETIVVETEDVATLEFLGFTPAPPPVGGGGIDELTGDVTAGPGFGAQVATLAIVNLDPGSFTSANITVNDKGLVTEATNGTGGAPLTVDDGSTTVTSVIEIQIVGGTVADGGSGIAIITFSGSSLAGFISALNTDPPNDSVNVSSLSAYGGTTAQGVAFVPKGGGFFALAIPDGTGTGGNIRGYGAVDLQVFSVGKNSATQIASGSFSSIGGGMNNTANGQGSRVGGGQNNTASGQFSTVPGGGSNTASGDFSHAEGDTTTASQTGSHSEGYQTQSTGLATHAEGRSTQAGGEASHAEGYLTITYGDWSHAEGLGTIADGPYSQSSGANSITRGVAGYQSYAAGQFAVVGDAQLSRVALRHATTSGAGAILTSDGGSPGTGNQLTLPDNSTYSFRAKILAREGATSDSSYWTIEGVVKRGSGVASVALLGGASPSLIVQDAGAAAWSVTVAPDTVNGALSFVVSGEVDKIINWVCRVETEELVF